MENEASQALKVLAVDDDRVTLSFVKACLSKVEDYEVSTETESPRALEMIRENRPDILVTDWMMPDVSGLDLCREVRSLEGDEYTYIVILTAKVAHKDKITGLETGADDYVIKPFEKDELVWCPVNKLSLCQLKYVK